MAQGEREPVAERFTTSEGVGQRASLLGPLPGRQPGVVGPGPAVVPYRGIQLDPDRRVGRVEDGLP
jgi:hypothetical protein